MAWRLRGIRSFGAPRRALTTDGTPRRRARACRRTNRAEECAPCAASTTSPPPPPAGARGIAGSPSAAGSPSSSPLLHRRRGRRSASDRRRDGQRRVAAADPRRSTPPTSRRGDEQVLVQGRGARAHPRRVRRRRPSSTSSARLQRAPVRQRRRVAARARPTRASSRTDGRSALVTFDIRGDARAGQGSGSTPRWPPRPRRSGRTPSCASSSSATRARTRRYRQGVQRATSSGRETHVAAGHAADPARRVRRARGRRRAAAARLTAVVAALGLLGADQPADPRSTSTISSVVLLIGLAVGVDYSMFYLRRKMEERDAGARRRGRARVRRRHLRPRRADLRPHRDDRDGRHVLRRQRGVHLVRHRHDARRRGRGARLADRAAGGDLPSSATASRRARVPVPRAAAPSQRRRVARVGVRRSTACCGAPLCRSPSARPLLVALALPALSMHTVDPGVAGPAAQHRRSCRPTTASRRRSPAARCRLRRRAGRRRHRAAGAGAASRAWRARRSRTAQIVRPGRRRPSARTGRSPIVSIPLAGNGHRRAPPTPRWRRLRHDVIPATIGRVAGRRRRT